MYPEERRFEIWQPPDFVGLIGALVRIRVNVSRTLLRAVWAQTEAARGETGCDCFNGYKDKFCLAVCLRTEDRIFVCLPREGGGPLAVEGARRANEFLKKFCLRTNLGLLINKSKF